LEDEQRVLQDCQKTARNLGEDALEDMVALDNLSKLFPEDQASRKQAIASLDALLEEVDAVKSKLLAVQKDLNSKLEQMAEHAAKKALDMAATDAEQPVFASTWKPWSKFWAAECSRYASTRLHSTEAFT